MPPDNSKLPNQPKRLPSPELIEKLFDIQAQELVFKQEELELRKQEDEHAYEFANNAVAAQGVDRQDARRHRETIIHKISVLSFCLALLFIAFLSFALFIGKEQIVSEIIKGIAYVIGGGAGGFVYGRYRKTAKEEVAEPLDYPN